MAAISNSLSLKHSFSLLLPLPSNSQDVRDAARTFVEHGMADGRLCIVTKEPYAPYERPALTRAYLFPPDKKPARLPGFHTCVGSGGERQTPEWYKENVIEMLYEDPVKDIDIEKHTLTTSSGKLLKYGSLIIATGCTASRFPEKIGGNLPGVHYIRHVADADALILSLEKAKKVVVVGGGYIGMEVAAAAVGWKLDATIIFPEDDLLQRLFTPSLARRYEELYQKNGVKVLKVIIGIGARPAVSPFERVGQNTDVGGIQVDGQFRTSTPGIFAVGDVAAFPLKIYNRISRVEHVDHARRSAQHCVKALLSKLKGVLLESGSPEEFQLLPKLARSQPLIDKAKLQNATSVEEALEIARGSLQGEAVKTGDIACRACSMTHNRSSIAKTKDLVKASFPLERSKKEKYLFGRGQLLRQWFIGSLLSTLMN
ncbi:hypothetical protein JHK82_013587 [Glycine max]|nr:hypothetical protein JHK82_013587 [Glycine max]